MSFAFKCVEKTLTHEFEALIPNMTSLDGMSNMYLQYTKGTKEIYGMWQARGHEGDGH
jgi:hypothetical protein